MNDNFHLGGGAVIHGQAKCAVAELIDHAAHAFFGVILHMLHVGVDGVEPILRDKFF